MTKAIPVAASMRTCRRLDARPSTVMPEEWKAQTGGPDAIFLGDRPASYRAGSCFAAGRSSNSTRSIGQSETGQADARRSLAAARAGGGRHRVLRRSREPVFIGRGATFASTEREAVIQETVTSRIGLDSIRRFALLPSRDLLARFLLGFLAANRAAGAKRKVRTVVRSCRNDRASDQSGTLTGTMSGTQFWSDHIFIGQAVPTAIFPIELRVTAAKSAVPHVQTVVATAEFPPGCGASATFRRASPCKRGSLPEALVVLKAMVSLHTKGRPTEATRIGIALAPAASSARSSSPTIRRTLRGAPDRLRTGRWHEAIASFMVRPSILPVLTKIGRLSSKFSHVSAFWSDQN